MKRVIALCAAAAVASLFVVPYPAAGRQNRPLTSDEAKTQEVETFELQTSYEYDWNADDTRSQTVEFYFTCGVTGRFDVGFKLTEDLKPEEGLEAAEINMKFHIFEEKKLRPATSLKFEYTLGGPAYNVIGILGKNVWVLATHFNVEYDATGVVGERGTLTYTGAVEVPAGDKVKLSAEISAATGPDTTPLEAVTGVAYQIIEELELDFGFSKGFIGLKDSDLDWSGTGGFSVSF